MSDVLAHPSSERRRVRATSPVPSTVAYRAASDAEQVADELFALRPERFTAARNARAPRKRRLPATRRRRPGSPRSASPTQPVDGPAPFRNGTQATCSAACAGAQVIPRCVGLNAGRQRPHLQQKRHGSSSRRCESCSLGPTAVFTVQTFRFEPRHPAASGARSRASGVRSAGSGSPAAPRRRCPARATS